MAALPRGRLPYTHRRRGQRQGWCPHPPATPPTRSQRRGPLHSVTGRVAAELHLLATSKLLIAEDHHGKEALG